MNVSDLEPGDSQMTTLTEKDLINFSIEDSHEYAAGWNARALGKRLTQSAEFYFRQGWFDAAFTRGVL